MIWNGYSFPIGMSVNERHLPMLDGYIGAGFTHFEIALKDAVPGADEVFFRRAERILERLDRAGIRPWSWHLPFGRGWDIAHPDEEERQRAVLALKSLIDSMAPSGARVLTVHGCLEPVSDANRAARTAQAIASLKELTAYSLERGLFLALENLPRSCLGNDAAELSAMLRASGCPGCCFDANHLLKESHEAFLDQLAHRVITTHFSDYDGEDERHWMPGKGIVPFGTVVTQLLDAGYRGPMLFEIKPGDGEYPDAEEVLFSFVNALDAQ